ncbi:MAG: hypothetical protein Q8Q20_04655 [bacterium]|nr:hypothetical protein [bacterium]
MGFLLLTAAGTYSSLTTTSDHIAPEMVFQHRMLDTATIWLQAGDNPAEDAEKVRDFLKSSPGVKPASVIFDRDFVRARVVETNIDSDLKRQLLLRDGVLIIVSTAPS